MADNFDETLDGCLDRVRAGEDVESVLGDYPTDSARLRPLLRAAVQTGKAYAFTPDRETKDGARRRFTATLAEMREARRLRQPWFRKAIARPAMWAAIGTIVVAIVVTIIGVQPALSPFFSPSQQVLPITPAASPEGNFVFLVSDEVNAIADFESVIVGIDTIGLQRDADGKWIEFTPEVTEVDLTAVPGDAVQEIWRGNIPAGEFRQVFVYVDNVTGILKNGGRRADIRLPGNKLHLSVPFAITDDSVTSFTYDMTVLAAGNQDNPKYILKPQASESGAGQQPRGGTGQQQSGGNGDINGRGAEQRPASLPTPTDRPARREK